MNIINKIKNNIAAILALLLLFTAYSCNKLYKDATPLAIAPNGSGANTLDKVLAASATDSLYNRLVIRSGILKATPATITDSSLRFTMFVPDNNAMKAFINAISGGAVPLGSPDAVFSGFISANIPVATAVAIVSYNIAPQAITSSSFGVFPNFIYPSIFNPAPTVSALFRLDVYPSKTGNGAYVNNIPLTAVDAAASNGFIHHTAAVSAPPSLYLWDRINTDTTMTYFKAAVQRADSGVAAASTLQGALQNIGANFTVFVPTDSAMRAAITGQITLALIAQGYPPAAAASAAAGLAATPAVFTNPALSGALTPTTVRGLVAYHILGIRTYTVNFPSTAVTLPTLIGGAPYPGVAIKASFTGPVASAATVTGKANPSASNLLLNPFSTSDQNYLNGVIHRIDQALFPQ